MLSRGIEMEEELPWELFLQLIVNFEQLFTYCDIYQHFSVKIEYAFQFKIFMHLS